MTTISAEMLQASFMAEHPNVRPIYTLQLRYPRFIHAELMTHRVFSRNASSSRAVPVPRLIEDIRRDPAIPLFWGANQPGMQAKEGDHTTKLVFTQGGGTITLSREDGWRWAMEEAIEMAERFHAAGYHKQIVNRLLEPFSHINVVVTSTKWENFFQLRDHPDAEPHIRMLAQAIKEAILTSKGANLHPGQWHLPYVTVQDQADSYAYLRNELRLSPTRERRIRLLVKMSVARCARVSYLTHDQKPTTFEADLKLHDQLLMADPMHASPAEHQAMAPTIDFEARRPMNGNLDEPWVQYRKLAEYEREIGRTIQWDTNNA